MIVAILILNPELVSMALFIDAIGLDVFLLLLEIQALAFFGALFQSKLKPVLLWLKINLSKDRCRTWSHPCIFWLKRSASPMALMHVLVLSAAINLALIP